MGLLERSYDLAQRAGRAYRAFSAAPAVPGLPNGPTAPPVDVRQDVVRVINSPEALLGRITYGAGPGYTRYSTYPADAIDPQRVKQIFRQADLGYPRLQAELYEQLIESDGHLRAVAEARIFGITRQKYRMQPRNETPLAICVAKTLKEIVDECENLDDAVESLLWASGYGYSSDEIVYDFRPVRVPLPGGGIQVVELLVPEQLAWVSQKHWEFDQVTDQNYLYISGRVTPPPGKFIFHTAGGAGLIERRGFMRPATPLLAAKRWSQRDWINFSAIYGVPQLEGIYDGDIGQQDAQRTLFEKILRDFGKGIPAIHPRDFEIKITNPPTGGRANDPQGAMIGWVNSEISKLVQHETLTTEMGGTGSYGASETHADVKFNVHLSDERRLSETLRRDLLTPILQFNALKLAEVFGVPPEEILAVVPSMRWRIDREMSPETRAKIYAIGVNELGAQISSDQFFDELGFDAPPPGRPALSGKPVPVGSGGTVGSVEASQEGKEPPQQPSPQPAPSR